MRQIAHRAEADSPDSPDTASVIFAMDKLSRLEATTAAQSIL